MADDPTPNPNPAPAPAPAFDPKQIEQMVQGAVRTSIESLVKEGQARQAEAEAEKANAPKAPAPDAMGDLFKPALEPAFQAAKNAETRAALAADAVDFYTSRINDPAVMKHRDKIEAIVTTQLKRGNLVSRADAWKYLRGGDLYEDLTKEALTTHEQKIKEAQAAAAAGPSVSVPKFSKPIDQSSTEELGEALKGITF